MEFEKRKDKKGIIDKSFIYRSVPFSEERLSELLKIYRTHKIEVRENFVYIFMSVDIWGKACYYDSCLHFWIYKGGICEIHDSLWISHYNK